MTGSPQDSAKAGLSLPRLTFISSAFLIIAPLLWVYAFAPFETMLDRRGHPLGADFPQFYVMGKFMLSEPARIYDEEAQMLKTLQLFPQMSPGLNWPVWYPPFVAGFFAPLALLPYPAAFAVFTGFNFVLAAFCSFLIWRALRAAPPVSRLRRIMLILGFPPVLECILGGQLSIIALVILCVTVLLLRRGQETAAGMVLALAVFKPNVLALFGLGTVILSPAMLVGMLPILLVLLLLSLLFVGFDGFFLFIYRGIQVMSDQSGTGTESHKILGMVNWFNYWFPDNGKMITLLIGIALTLCVTLAWTKSLRKGPAYPAELLAALVTINCLCNPYLPLYDLALLSVVLFELYSSGCLGHPAQRKSEFFLIACYCAPHLSQALAAATGVQLFPFLLMVLLFLSTRRLKRLSPAEAR